MICAYQEYDNTFFPEMNSKGQRTDISELIFQFLTVHLKTKSFKVWGNCLKKYFTVPCPLTNSVNYHRLFSRKIKT